MQDATTTPPPPAYPVRLSMEYPERLSRLSTLFRIVLAIPVLLFLALLGGATLDFWRTNDDGYRTTGFASAAGGGIVIAIWAAVLVRGRIPHWLFNFQVALHRFNYRAFAYLALLTDRYPAFEGDWLLQYDVDYPQRISRWRLLFWKALTSIPHFIVLFFLGIAAFVVVVIAWFAILFSGAFPKGLHRFIVGVMRWGARVTAYFESLTDVFPPFSLDDDAGPASHSTLVTSAIVGGVIVLAVAAGAGGGAFAINRYLTDAKTADVSYEDALAGALDDREGTLTMDDVTFSLEGGADPATVSLIAARPGRRIVEFTVEFRSARDRSAAFGAKRNADERIERDAVRIELDSGKVVKPLLLTFDVVATPVDIAPGADGELRAVFEIDDDAVIDELRAYPNAGNSRHIAWRFRQ